MKALFLILTVLSILFLSCAPGQIKSSSYSKNYLPGEDYNPSSQNLLDSDDVFASTDKGLYFIANDYLFYLDYATMKAEPFCFRPDCLHNKENDQDKVLDCDAFLGSCSAGDLIACYNNKIYTICVNRSTGTGDLIEMELDGSSRRTVISDLPSKKAVRPLLHRGVIYYTTQSYSLDGETKAALMAYSLISGSKEPEAVYTVSENGYLRGLFPCRDQVFFYEAVYKEGTAEIKSIDLMKYDIRTRKTERITSEGEWQIYGVRDNKVIVNSSIDNHYYTYSMETGVLSRENGGLNAFTEAHPDWFCHAECITDDMNVFSCRRAEGHIEDLFVTDAYGNELCVIPGAGWSRFGSQMISIDDEDYMIRSSYSIRPFSIKLYKKSDLMAGKVEPLTILEVDDINQDLSKPYVVHLK